MGGWTITRSVSLGLLPSGPDPVGEGCVHRQPPARYMGDLAAENKRGGCLRRRVFQARQPPLRGARTRAGRAWTDSRTGLSTQRALEADCYEIGDLPLCRVLLMDDARYPWLILVPRGRMWRSSLIFPSRTGSNHGRDRAGAEVIRVSRSPTRSMSVPSATCGAATARACDRALCVG